MSKTIKILQHLQTYGSITPWDAIFAYNTTRLSAIIYNLRKAYIIETDTEKDIDQYGNVSYCAVYKYKGEIPDSELDDKSKKVKSNRLKAANKRVRV